MEAKAMLRQKAQPRANASTSGFTLSADEIHAINAKGGPTFSPRKGGRVAINQLSGRGAFPRARISYIRAVCAPQPVRSRVEELAQTFLSKQEQRRKVALEEKLTVICPHCRSHGSYPPGEQKCWWCLKVIVVPVRVVLNRDTSATCPVCNKRYARVRLGKMTCAGCSKVLEIECR